MTRHIEQARADLGDLHGLSAKTEAAERNILKSAEKRHAAVVSELDDLRAGIEGMADDVQDRYLALAQERGQLDLVIAKARSILSH